MNARKLPSGRWQSKVYIGTVDGKKKFKTVTEDSRRECLLKAAEIAADVSVQRDSMYGKITVSEAVQRYIDSNKGTLSPSTIRSYTHMKEKRIDVYPIAGCLLTDLTQEKVQAWISGMAGDLSKKSIKNIYGLFSPAVKMFRSRLPFEVEYPKGKKYKGYVPSTDEVIRLLQRAKEENIDLYRACLLAAFSTLRRGEISCLTAESIQGNILHVESDMVYGDEKKWVIKQIPKEEASVRDIPLPQWIVDEMPKAGRLVNLNPEEITRFFEKTMKKVDIPAFRFHDLRKHAVSLMASKGVSMASIKDLGGWSNIETPQRIYIHALEDAHQREVAGYLEHLNSLDLSGSFAKVSSEQ